MALIVTVSYSVSHSKDEPEKPVPNLTSSIEPAPPRSLSHNLKLTYGPDSYIFGSSNAEFPWPRPPSPPPSSFNPGSATANAEQPILTQAELEEGLQAGQEALQRRISADTAALASPLPSPSPESRHQYAVSTKSAVSVYALAAVAEIAATRKIEAGRRLFGRPSAFGASFNGGWAPSGACKDFKDAECTVERYRTFDGTCNRPRQWGSTLTPYKRTIPAVYADGIESPRRAASGKELPSAREVSLNVHKPAPSSNPLFTVMLAVFGQFLDHDITATAISQGVNGTSISCCAAGAGHPECFPVRVGSGDPVYDVAGRTCMEFVRSAPAPKCKLGPREQLNQVTAFIDGSAIYGSDLQTANDLREFSGGRLKMQITPDNRTLLPPSTNANDGCNRDAEKLRGRYCFAAGDARANENLHLTTMHLLWARQHNKVAAELAQVNPFWSDEKLYQESRRLIGAQLQHITYQEFVPIVLGDGLVQYYQLKPLTEGYRIFTESPDDPVNDPRIANSFAAAAFRFAHTLLPGLMRVTDSQKGTSSYVELHRMLFNPYSLYAQGGVKSSVQSAAANLIQKTSTHVTSQLTSHLFEDPLGNATVPCGLDLVSLNIQRGRDHGLAGYVMWREYCGLGKVSEFSDLVEHLDPRALEEIAVLYDAVEDVDLYTGALAEIPKAGGIVGPTFACLIADQFVRLQKGDRYWYEIGGQPHSFEPEQLQEIRKFSLARLICDCSDGVTEIQAEVMRAVGPDNPMMSCEDISKPSLESWKERSADTPTLHESSMINWLSLKKHINDTIQQVVSFINFTRTSAFNEPTTDWLSFKSYVNNSFADLRNELAKLHPKKIVGDSFVLRETFNSTVRTAWTTLKNEILKSLNASIESLTIPPIGGQWIEFKRRIEAQFADLRNELDSVKNTLAPKSVNHELSDKSSRVSFDWVHLKVYVIQAIDAAIQEISANVPPIDDPAWAKYGEDVKSRLLSHVDKIVGEMSTLPTKSKHEMEMKIEVETKGEAGSKPTDWVDYKNEIVKTVNSVVKKIQDEMPAPGDPAWASYRSEILSDFSVFDQKFPRSISNASVRMLTYGPVRPDLRTSLLKASSPAATKMTDEKLADLIDDWNKFRSKINESVDSLVARVKDEKLLPVSAAGWAAFKNSVIDEFSNLNAEVAYIKSEWTSFAKSKQLNGNPSKSPYLQSSKKKPANAEFDIPEADWLEFKNEINSTVTSLLSTNATNETAWKEVGKAFDDSFANIRNEIISLKNIAATDDDVPSDWSEFRAKLNSTVRNLIDDLNNRTEKSTIDLMKVLLDARDQFAKLEIPTSIAAVVPSDYFVGVNETFADLLDKIGQLKRPTLTLRSIDPSAASFPSNSDGFRNFQSALMLAMLALSLAAA